MAAGKRGTQPHPKKLSSAMPKRTRAATTPVPEEELRVRRPWGAIFGAAVKSIIRTGLMSTVVMGPGVILMGPLEQPLAGSIWLLLGAFGMMAWSYRRQWRLMWITCLAPPLSAGASWAVQVAMVGDDPNVPIVATAIGVGLVVGLIRGGAHETFVKDDAVFARRTVGYLAVWLVCYLLSQLFSIMGRQEGGRAAGAFATAMLLSVSLVLLVKYLKTRRALRAGAVAGLVMLASALHSDPALASPQAQEPAGGWNQILDYPLPEGAVLATNGYAVSFGQENTCILTGSLYYPDRRDAAGRVYQDQSFAGASILNYCLANWGTPAYSAFCSRCDIRPPIYDEGGADEATTAAIVASVLILLGSGAVNMANAIAAALIAAGGGAARAPGSRSGPRRPRTRPTKPLVDPDSKEDLIVQDGSYEGGKIGQVWYDGQWTDRKTARGWIRDRQKEIRRREKESEAFERESRRVSEEWLREKEEEGRRAQEAVERERAEAEARAAAKEATQARVREGARTVAEREGGDVQAEIDALLADGNMAGLEDLYRDYLGTRIARSSAEAATEQAWATAYGVGEGISRATLAASKGAMMAVGGPAGWLATGVGVGVIGMAQDGAESWDRGDSWAGFAANSTVGFLGGFKDGATAVYTATAKIGMLPRVLTVAGLDGTETWIRTGGNVKVAVGVGMVSSFTEMGGVRIGKMGSWLGRQTASASMSTVAAGTQTYVHGGSFTEGMQTGFTNYIAGKAGARAARGGLGMSNFKPPAGARNDALPDGPAGPGSKQGPDLEGRVKTAIGEAGESRKKTIPLPDPDAAGKGKSPLQPEGDGPKQPPIIAELNKTRRTETVTGKDGTTSTAEFVDPKRALDQLGDTRSSRTGKQADPDLRDAIVRTRQAKLYDPADATTIKKAVPKLKEAGLLRDGDTVEMDSFSTPGKPPSLGADRDARLVIRRPVDPKDPSKGTIAIEVDRKHWENDAYEDFYDHTRRLAESGGQEVTKKTHKDFFGRMEDLAHLRRPETPAEIQALKEKGYTDARIAQLQREGLTQRQIDARAWGAAHNQLFTDKNHTEASHDYADQGVQYVNGRAERTQVESNSRMTAEGHSTLQDAEGFGRMWVGKSEDYVHHNRPEAVAQTQKGIEQLMALRDGYRAQKLEPPPLDARTARAMEIVTRAPVGMDATPGAMDKVEADLQGLGYRNMTDALEKLNSQAELLKWSRTKPLGPIQAPVAPPPPDTLGAAQLARLVKKEGDSG